MSRSPLRSNNSGPRPRESAILLPERRLPVRDRWDITKPLALGFLGCGRELARHVPELPEVRSTKVCGELPPKELAAHLVVQSTYTLPRMQGRPRAATTSCSEYARCPAAASARTGRAAARTIGCGNFGVTTLAQIDRVWRRRCPPATAAAPSLRAQKLRPDRAATLQSELKRRARPTAKSS